MIEVLSAEQAKHRVSRAAQKRQVSSRFRPCGRALASTTWGGPFITCGKAGVLCTRCQRERRTHQTEAHQ